MSTDAPNRLAAIRSQVTDRDAHEFYAKQNGYFWLPCGFPGCGRMFGGHECGLYSIQDKDDEHLASMTCKLHDDFARGIRAARNPGVEYSEGSGYTGDPEADFAFVNDILRRKLAGEPE